MLSADAKLPVPCSYELFDATITYPIFNLWQTRANDWQGCAMVV